MKSDKQLQQDVLDELKWDPSVDASKIGVTAKDGVVTLIGSIGQFAQRLAAERIAKRVSGVLAVANDLAVELTAGGQRSDTEIATAVVNAMKWDVSVPDGRIKAAVSNGYVTLEGEVDWDFQRQAAFKAVRNLTGVKAVTNLITLRKAAATTEVKKEIREAFHRSADLDANSIEVEAVDGKVVLRGKVRSWSEKQQAESAAWRASGVSNVQNNLTIQIA
jgi:osmotically-inducible protein OsmY